MNDEKERAAKLEKDKTQEFFELYGSLPVSLQAFINAPLPTINEVYEHFSQRLLTQLGARLAEIDEARDAAEAAVPYSLAMRIEELEKEIAELKAKKRKPKADEETAKPAEAENSAPAETETANGETDAPQVETIAGDQVGDLSAASAEGEGKHEGV